MAKNPSSSWRRNLDIPSIADKLVKAAIQLQIEGISDESDFHDPTDTKLRKARADLAIHIIETCLDLVGEGVGSEVELGTSPQGYFYRSRIAPTKNEVTSQREALAKYLGREPGVEILMTESDFVTAAIKAARELGHGAEYGLTRLIHDGISRVGQELISNAVARDNRKQTDTPSHTAPGCNWDIYEKSYQELQAIVGTKSWKRRKPYITLTYIAQANDGTKSNSVQLRRWAEATGKTIVPQPRPDEDQSAGGLIVDDKLKRDED